MLKKSAIAAITLVALFCSAIPRVNAEQITMASNAAVSGQINCQNLSTATKIPTIAKLLVRGQDGMEVKNCYNTLSNEDKAQVFEAVAKERGLLQALWKEGNENQSQRSQIASITAGISWQQLIERIPFSAVGKTLRSVTNSYQDPYCDGTDPDVDYTFVVPFPYAVSNPDSLRSFASVTLVDAMLTWYQIRYGGINGRGNTSSSNVYLCIGDTGVATAGGQVAVRNALKLHDNN